MAKKKKLFSELLEIFIWIVADYAIYRGILFSSSHNLFKELQGAWFVFYAFSVFDFFAFDTIHNVLKESAQRHGTARSPKAETIIKLISGITKYVLVPLTIVMTAIVSILFFAILIASAFMLTLSKSLMLYMIFTTTVLMYIVVMYYGIEVWRYKKAQRY